jgi:RNA polymerase sigma-70 factor (ECF subfamily)
MIEDLVRKCQSGDEKAFCELFRVHGGLIQKVTCRMLHNRELRKDVFQEVVRSVIENIGKFRGECQFSTWLYRITANTAIDYLKKERRYVGIDEDAATQEEGGGIDRTQLDKVESKELLSHAQQALLQLPDRYRQMLSLFYFGQLSIGEIAAVTGRSEGAVKVALFKGRGKMVRYLRKRGIFESKKL